MRILHLAAITLIAAAAMPQAARAAQVDCGILEVVGVTTVPGTETTSSQTYTPIASNTADTSLFINCAHVQFSAQFKTKTPKVVRLRVTVDGTPKGFPNFITLTTSGAGFDERAATFLIPGLSGTRVIAVELLSDNGTPVSVRNGLLRVLYSNDM